MLNPPRRRRIYLMRHAEAAYVQEDGSVTDNERQVALTPLGRTQARKQAGLLGQRSLRSGRLLRPAANLGNGHPGAGRTGGTSA